MKLALEPIDRPDGRCWQVRLDQHCVSFRSEAEARQFLATLQARLQAPHALPGSRLRAAS
ncbi:hypothetical protein [Pseudomonas xionganensis]|uniref:Uncharacterized protein n=1 Tax=Pseudomonas xionganensis TaxID=2654845 RepID=A0A6I4KQS3_9PSED|nr:hypothetical protein [Pseudomonas xionganensis]MVW74705.1 hypothetical protein [Pseudomonas xionganensis]